MPTAATLPESLPTHATASTQVLTMQAVVHRRYGTPEVLAIAELPRPVPGPDEVCVRVHAAGVSVGDHHVVTGKPYLIRLSPFGGLPRPRHPVPGMALAGRIAAVGPNVTGWQIGDEVFAEAKRGAFAEYALVPVQRLAPKPSNLSFEDAAACPWGVVALQALRDAGRLAPGQRVLINGASGGVGTWAVQIAKALGAHVTAVCSTRHIALVRSLGADAVIDYTTEDFTLRGDDARFDVVLDLIANHSVAACRRVLTPRGTYVACAGGGGDWVGPMFRILGMMCTAPFTRRRLKPFMASPNGADLRVLKGMIEAGQVRPIIERRHALAEVAVALAHVGAGHAQGQTVLTIAG